MDGTGPTDPDTVTAKVQDGHGVDEVIRDISDLIEVLSALGRSPGSWYRGQGDHTWQLIPGARRNLEVKKRELDLLKRFMQECAGSSPYPNMTEWDWVSFAQHHRIPTRLLDWSTSPLIGLYFAVDEEHTDATDGRLFELDPAALNEETYGEGCGVLLLGVDPDLDDYMVTSRKEQIKGPVAVVAAKNFDRISAQAGVFTITHPKDAKPFDERAADALRSWVIPFDAKQHIRDQLQALGIDASYVYRDLDRRAAGIKKELLP